MKTRHLEAIEKHKHPNKAFHESLSLTDRIALGITNNVGTMGCVATFIALSLVGLPAALASGNAFVIVTWVSQTFLQLVLLPLIMVGQNLQSRHAEIRAETDHRRLQKLESDIEEIRKVVVK